MQKFQVWIPKPGIKKADVKIVVEYGGFFHSAQETYNLAKGQTHFEFEVPDNFEYVYAGKDENKFVFNVRVEFSNENGKKEQNDLVPSKLS